MDNLRSLSTSDEDLFLRTQHDDRAAFEQLYERHVKKIYREISKRVKVTVAAEELTQDVFISLWEKRLKIQLTGTSLLPYLYGMAINRVLNYYRSNKIPQSLIVTWENLPEEVAGLTELSQAFKQAHTQEMESLLDVAMETLPPKMLEVYKLRYEQNLSIAEIAEGLSISPNTVHNQLKNARKRFLEALKNTSFYFI